MKAGQFLAGLFLKAKTGIVITMDSVCIVVVISICVQKL